MSPDISVVIAAYNVERYIERSINSALIQADGADAPTIEIIVIDDHSTDRTWEIISRMDDPRLQCIRLSANGGPAAARNAGIAHASGRWIAILDGDDAFFSGRLARFMRLAAGEKADIVVDNLSVFCESNGAMFPMFLSSRLEKLPVLSLSGFIAGNQSFMGGYALGYMKPFISAEFLRRHKLFYDTGLRIGEDYFLLAQALAAGARCIVDPAAGYLYTSRVGSVSHRLTKGDIQQIAAGERKFLSKYKLPPAAAKAQRKREAHLKEAYAFACLVEAIKSKDIPQVFQTAMASPLAVRHLWRPVWRRVRKMIPFLFNQKGELPCPQQEIL